MTILCVFWAVFSKRIAQLEPRSKKIAIKMKNSNRFPFLIGNQCFEGYHPYLFFVLVLFQWFKNKLVFGLEQIVSDRQLLFYLLFAVGINGMNIRIAYRLLKIWMGNFIWFTNNSHKLNIYIKFKSRKAAT